MKNSYLQPVLYAVLISISIFFGYNLNSKKSDSKILNLLKLIEENYVDTVNISFEEEIITSILGSLDPHSTYIAKNDFKIESQRMEGEFSGIGIEFNIISDTVVVVAPISGGPSEKLGVKSGDKIIAVEQENIANIKITNTDVIDRLRGEKNTQVNITVKRSGMKNLLNFNIIRDNIPLNSIDASFMLDDSTAYIKINRFSAQTYREFNTATNKLLANNMKQLILDLRDNPGGYLRPAIQICDDFFEEDILLVYTEGKERKRQDLISSKKGLLKNITVRILINEGSASASEIIAGAFQDNDRGIIVGRRSFGKGLVQEEMILKDNSAIRLTTQRYYTPSGRSIQKSYQGNIKDYYLEQYQREEKNNDSTIFTTRLGRTVYGGGGITPDHIISKPENINYQKVNHLISKRWLTEFSIGYAMKIKADFPKEFYAAKSKFLSANNKIDYFNQFEKLIHQKDSEFNFQMGEVELNYLKTLIIANLARIIWNDEAYYTIISNEDETIKKAKNL
ncbi:MAG: S41 family peptidase [Bacteroidota bacterium]|nr:S41 family peptidase [Bacteroidota bacterium]